MEEDGVRVNALCPFFCDTEMVRQASAVYPKDKMEYFKALGQAE